MATLGAAAWEIAAVLTSPFASAWLWHRGAGSGLSANTVRSSPVVLAELPWPGGDLAAAVRAARVGDVRACGARVDAAYGIADDTDARVVVVDARSPVLEARQPLPTSADGHATLTR